MLLIMHILLIYDDHSLLLESGFEVQSWPSIMLDIYVPISIYIYLRLEVIVMYFILCGRSHMHQEHQPKMFLYDLRLAVLWNSG